MVANGTTARCSCSSDQAEKVCMSKRSIGNAHQRRVPWVMLNGMTKGLGGQRRECTEHARCTKMVEERGPGNAKWGVCLPCHPYTALQKHPYAMPHLCMVQCNLGSLATVASSKSWCQCATWFYRNTIAIRNSGHGFQSLRNNSEGTGNSASGYRALYNNATGNYNSGIGYSSNSAVESGCGIECGK